MDRGRLRRICCIRFAVTPITSPGQRVFISGSARRSSIPTPALWMTTLGLRARGPRAHSPITPARLLGAANLLGHTNDARLAADYTMSRVGRGGLMPRYGENGDGGGFNGICARWIAKFMKQRGLESRYQIRRA